MKTAPRLLSFVALILCWLGYFSPWLWPVPAALRLSAHDLVEWMTFMQTVRDGTFPVTRLDLLWPLAGIAALNVLVTTQIIEPQRRKERQEISKKHLSGLRTFAVNYWPELLSVPIALFAAALILPPYEFIRSAPTDPELAPQFWLGIATGIAVIPLAAFAIVRPQWARWFTAITALLSLTASVRVYLIIRPPFADLLAKPAPVGYGFILVVIGFAAFLVLPLVELLRVGSSTRSS